MFDVPEQIDSGKYSPDDRAALDEQLGRTVISFCEKNLPRIIDRWTVQ